MTALGTVIARGLLSARPAAGSTGALYYATDTLRWYRDNGSGWDDASGNPMTTSGDIIYGGTSGLPTRLAKGSDGQVLTLASGVPSWAAAASGSPSFVGCRLTNSGNVAIAHATVSIVTWDTETIDTNGYHSTVSSTGKITIPSGGDGKYRFEAELQWAENGTGFRWMALYKNGSIYQYLGHILRGDTSASFDLVQSQSGSAVAPAVATDYFEVRVYQTSGGSLNITAIDAPSSFTAQFLGA